MFMSTNTQKKGLGNLVDHKEDMKTTSNDKCLKELGRIYSLKKKILEM